MSQVSCRKSPDQAIIVVGIQPWINTNSRHGSDTGAVATDATPADRCLAPDLQRASRMLPRPAVRLWPSCPACGQLCRCFTAWVGSLRRLPDGAGVTDYLWKAGVCV